MIVRFRVRFTSGRECFFLSEGFARRFADTQGGSFHGPTRFRSLQDIPSFLILPTGSVQQAPARTC